MFLPIPRLMASFPIFRVSNIDSLCPFFCVIAMPVHSWESLPAFKDSFDQIGPPWMRQGNLPILSLSLSLSHGVTYSQALGIRTRTPLGEHRSTHHKGTRCLLGRTFTVWMITSAKMFLLPAPRLTEFASPVGRTLHAPCCFVQPSSGN